MSDDRIIGNRALDHFDVLVIGSGCGGGTAAGLLAQKGMKVLVLEAGPNFLPGLDDPDPKKLLPLLSNDEIKLQRRYFIQPDPLVEPRSFRRRERDGDRKTVGDVNHLPKTVGGGILHADIKMPRFQPDDFKLGTLIGAKWSGAAFADWPIDYDVLEPFYSWTEQALGVQGLAGSCPTEGRRSGPYPMPPGAAMYGGLVLSEAATRLGYVPHPYPCAVNSRPYDGRPPCNDCGFCSGYGCPTSAKGTPAVTILRKGLLSGNLRLHAETRAVKLLRTGRSIRGVEAIDPSGRRQTFTADRYVLAASPIEDARLLLLSDPGGPGIGNSSGLLGRNLMFHFQTLCIGIFKERMHAYRGKAVSHGMTDFRGKPNDPLHPLAGILEFGGAGPLLQQSVDSRQLLGLGPQLKSFIRQGTMADRLLAMTLQAEDAPQAENRIDLDPGVRDLDGLPVARITYENHPFELSARDFYAPKLMDLMVEAGAKYVFVPPADEVPASRHVMGTLRFGTDPKTSVCNPAGRLHDLDNLYAADGALFPTSSGFNPSLTIAALAAYVAGDIVSPGSPGKVLT